MARYKQGIVGPITGKPGAVIGSSWKGAIFASSIRRVK